jgi:hypothetical protein
MLIWAKFSVCCTWALGPCQALTSSKQHTQIVCPKIVGRSISQSPSTSCPSPKRHCISVSLSAWPHRRLLPLPVCLLNNFQSFVPNLSILFSANSSAYFLMCSICLWSCKRLVLLQILPWNRSLVLLLLGAKVDYWLEPVIFLFTTSNLIYHSGTFLVLSTSEISLFGTTLLQPCWLARQCKYTGLNVWLRI